MAKIRVLHVDDSAVIRGIISRILEGDDAIELVASASDGQKGVDAYKEHKPDVVIMDIEMPVMDGITALGEIIKHDRKAKVIMCSTLSVDNAEITMRAMKIGAIDYIAKPTSAGQVSGSAEFKEHLLRLVKNIKGTIKSDDTAKPKLYKNEVVLRAKPPLHWHASVVAVGSSTGGPQALFEFMKQLKGINLPVVITQHMPPTFTTLLAKHISSQAGFECAEAESGMPLEKGKALLAPGGKHMEFTKNSMGQVVVNLTDGPQENFCKPAVDPMCRSLEKYYSGKILSVILTGMGQDGTEGARKIIESGGYCVAQDEATSVVWGMPGSVATQGLCSAVLPLNDIAPWVKEHI